MREDDVLLGQTIDPTSSGVWGNIMLADLDHVIMYGDDEGYSKNIRIEFYRLRFGAAYRPDWKRLKKILKYVNRSESGKNSIQYK